MKRLTNFLLAVCFIGQVSFVIAAIIAAEEGLMYPKLENWVVIVVSGFTVFLLGRQLGIEKD